MHMVLMALKCEYFQSILCTDLLDQCPEVFFNTGSIKYLSAVSGAEHEMIAEQGYCRFCSSIAVFHAYIIAESVDVCQVNIYFFSKNLYKSV